MRKLRFFLLFALVFTCEKTILAQLNLNEALSLVLKKYNACEVNEKSDEILGQFQGRDIYDSLYLWKELSIRIHQCDPKSSLTYINQTLKFASRSNLYDTLYRELFSYRIAAEESEILRDELNFYYDYLNNYYSKNQNLKKSESYYWLCKELISLEETLRNYVNAKKISEILLEDLSFENQDFHGLLEIKKILLNISIAQSHYSEIIKYGNEYEKICKSNFQRLREDELENYHFHKLLIIESRIMLSDTVELSIFKELGDIYSDKRKYEVQYFYLKYLQILNALGKYEYSKNLADLYGLEQLFKEIEKKGLPQFIPPEFYYSTKYIYSIHTNTLQPKIEQIKLNPATYLSYSIDKQDFQKADSIIEQLIKSGITLNKFKGYSSEEILMSRNLYSGLAINALGNYFLVHQNVSFLSDLYSNYSGYHLNVNSKLRKNNHLLCEAYAQMLSDNSVNSKQVKDVYRRSIDSLDLASNDFINNFSDSICKLLAENEVFIQWIYVPYRFNFSTFNSAEEPFYIQLSYQSNGEISSYIHKDAELVHTAIDYWKTQIQLERPIDSTLISIITEPINAVIKGKTSIIICPAGRLLELPLESMPIQNDYLLNRYSLQVVNSAYSLLEIKNNPDLIKNARGEVAIIGTQNYKNAFSESFVDLPGVEAEINQVVKLCEKNKILFSTSFNNGNEEAQLKNLKNPYIIHIAAHGIIYSDESIQNNHNLLRNKESINTPNINSGLVFSNSSKPSQFIINDQIINDIEMGLMDLRQTYLVTLSSCFSGLGQETLSDGTMGFRKSIAEAGAKFTLVANWSVNDKITAEFMGNFYYHLLEKKEDCQIAFKNAQLELYLKYKLPYYWTSFTLVTNY
jgi:CHAT domain-containing protein